MMLLLALSLLTVLMYRLGWFRPLQEHREALTFESQVLMIAEDVEWEERMARARQKRPDLHNRPRLHFRPKRKSS